MSKKRIAITTKGGILCALRIEKKISVGDFIQDTPKLKSTIDSLGEKNQIQIMHGQQCRRGRDHFKKM